MNRRVLPEGATLQALAPGNRSFASDSDSSPIDPASRNDAELLGRVRAVLRRAAGVPLTPPRLTTTGALTLDGEAQEAFWNGRPIGLTPIEFAILAVLTRAAGRVVSGGELTAVLHQREATPYERSLDMHVSHVRRKIAAASREEGARAPDDPGTSIIRTARGVGYLCSLEV